MRCSRWDTKNHNLLLWWERIFVLISKSIAMKVYWIFSGLCFNDNILYLMNLLKIYLPTLLMMFDVFTILSFRYATRISIFSFRNTPCFWFFPVHSIFPRGATKGFFALIMPITVLLKSSYCSKISVITFSPDTFACLSYHIAEFTAVWNNSN